MIRSRPLRWSALLMACSATLLACTSDGGDGAGSGAEEITVMVAGDPEELEAYRQVARGFESIAAGRDGQPGRDRGA